MLLVFHAAAQISLRLTCARRGVGGRADGVCTGCLSREQALGLGDADGARACSREGNARPRDAAISVERQLDCGRRSGKVPDLSLDLLIGTRRALAG